MPSRNRGKQSNDDKLFAPKWQPIFKNAVDDFCFLLSRGYSENSIGQLVGNRYKLNARQRIAIHRISASAAQIQARKEKEVLPIALKGQTVEIDGFNILILLESALSGGYILEARDGSMKDISSIHGSYKRVIKTEESIFIIGDTLQTLGIAKAKWYLDQPVSNSGRLKTFLLEIAAKRQFNWEVELVYNPDKQLGESQNIVITSDGWILDNARQWFNLGASIIKKQLAASNLIAV